MIFLYLYFSFLTPCILYEDSAIQSRFKIQRPLLYMVVHHHNFHILFFFPSFFFFLTSTVYKPCCIGTLVNIELKREKRERTQC